MTAAVRRLTAPGPGAVCVLDVRGADACARLEALVAGRLPSGPLGLVHLTQAGEDLDEALVVRRGPEHLELHLHGSPPLVRRVLACLDPDRARAPERSDSAPLELRARLVAGQAPTRTGAVVAWHQGTGILRAAYESLATLQGPDFEALRSELAERGRVAAYQLRPARVVLSGPVNAGKSTLFNALIGERRVVVTDQAGTTRDAIHATTHMDAYAVELFDTAGERRLTAATPDASVERQGQVLARELARGADWELRLEPASSNGDGGGRSERDESGRDSDRDPLESGEQGGASHAAVPGEAPVRWTLLRSRGDELVPGDPRGPEAISAHADPGGARVRVAAAFCAAFDLPPGGLGTVSQAVPFEPAQLGILADLRGSRPGPGRLALVEALLQPR